MSVFSLEALDARFGDCLLVHFGDPGHPQTLVVDAGPRGTFETLGRRLEDLRQVYWEDGALPLDLVVATHIDNDHICGLIEMAEAMLEGPFGPQLAIRGFWLNTFERSVGAGADAEPSLGEDLALASIFLDPPREASSLDPVIAGVAEGDLLARLAGDLGWPRNPGFEELVRMDDSGALQSLGDLVLHVVMPDEARLRELARRFRETSVEGAATPDDSVSNLASIVLLLELNGSRMLLTGDARSDHVLEGLEKVGVLGPGDRLRLSVLKLPHHGSERNVVSDEFFERLPADHYVISADGLHGNPDVETLERLMRARGDDDFTIHMTYAPELLRQPAAGEVSAFFERQRALGRRFEVSSRPPEAASLLVELGQPMI